MNQAKRIPVSIISGFLGAGKTTLLNHILNGDHGLNITVMVNDFGAINIDQQLISQQDANTVNLKNGCICCSIQGDLVVELQRLLHHPDGAPEYVLIESSGVSDPTRIVHALGYPQVRNAFQLDTVLSLINVEQINHLQGEYRHLAMCQLDAADIILLNKTDCVDAETLAQVRQDWLYPAARTLETSYARIPTGLLFDNSAPRVTREPGQSDSSAPSHTDLFQQWSWHSDQPIGLAELEQAIRKLPYEVFRAKGIFQTKGDDESRVVLQQVGPRTDWQVVPADGHGTGCELVLIGKQGSLDTRQLDAIFQAYSTKKRLNVLSIKQEEVCHD